MADHRVAVVGIGATGSVLAASLLQKHSETVLVDPMPGLGQSLRERGIKVSGAVTCQASVGKVFASIGEIKDFKPTIVFVCTKTFHLPQVIEELKDLFQPGMKIISTHNGLGTEDAIADPLGSDAVFRMSLNYGAAVEGPGDVKVTFFNRPNHLGGLVPENRELGIDIARMLTGVGLDTEFVDDIKRFVWKKMIMKCTMASICAVTDKTIKEALDFPPTREIADACFNEALSVAKAVGYDLGEDYLKQALAYLEKVGVHKDSMCQDIANKTPTEIDFLGGKVVEYGREKGVPTPFYIAMTNLVKTIEDTYLRK
jgi:2-dehydropantoate 2-reductase